MVREAKLEDSEFGKSGPGGGWFVVNGREARWRRREQRGVSLNLTGQTDEECETHFDQLGVNLNVLEPGEIIGFYHWEADQEGFLVLYGEALLVIEGEERPLRQWDYVHMPPGTKHTLVGAGSGPCGVLALGSREHIGEACNGGEYVAGEAAARHGASVTETKSDASDDYAALGKVEPVAYREGWLPGP